MKRSQEVMTGEDIEKLLDDLKSCIEYYESCKELLGDDGFPIAASEGASSGLRWIVADAEKIRRLMQPHWYGFEEDSAASLIEAEAKRKEVTAE